MKRFNRLLIGLLILCLAVVLLAGCGIPKSEHEALQAEHATLLEENSSLKTKNTSLKGELDTAQSDLTDTKANLTIAQTELTTAEADLANAQSKYDSLNASYGAVQKELADIKKVYPPRDFSSVQELRDWLAENDVSERPASTTAEDLYAKALEIQEDALTDGYIISAWIEYYLDSELFAIACTAVADGNVWVWAPETDELIDFSGGSGLLKVR